MSTAQGIGKFSSIEKGFLAMTIPISAALVMIEDEVDLILKQEIVA